MLEERPGCCDIADLAHGDRGSLATEGRQPPEARMTRKQSPLEPEKKTALQTPCF